MAVSKTRILDELRRVKGPDLEGNIVDLDLVSEIMIKDERVYFSITVPAARAEQLEPLRQAAEQVVGDLEGVNGVVAVLTAEAGAGRAPLPPSKPAPKPSKPQAANAKPSADGSNGVASAAPDSASKSLAKGASTAQSLTEAKSASGAQSSAQPSTDAPSKNGASGEADIHDHPRLKEAKARMAGKPAAEPPPAPGDLVSKGGAKPQAAKVPGVRHLIAVASGKGGVGKSTTAVNLALGLRALGLKTGILDADIYGPSQPRLLGLKGKPTPAGTGNLLKPMEGYDIKAMSMGFMVDEATPIVWRGPMVASALNQMLREVAWGSDEDELDVLVIDMPPGTGDVQLTIAQQVPLSGAIIVSTPQDLALIDARKGLNMFRKVDVPVLGIIENMSVYVCPECGHESYIFGHNGAKEEAEKLGLTFLGGVPLHMDVRETSDAGTPITVTKPDSPHAQIYRDLAAGVWSILSTQDGATDTQPKLMITGGGAGLNVTFDNGATHDLSAEYLRVLSPSAEVQGHTPSQRKTVAKKKLVKISKMQAVGNYAVKLHFDDGHNTGLYTWTYLDALGREKKTRWADYLKELKDKGLARE